MRVCIIGAGNVAFHLWKAFSRSPEIQLLPLVVRNEGKARQLFGSGHPFFVSTDLRGLDADLFILAVADQAIEDVLTIFQFPEQSIVVHTSGSTDMRLFDQKGFRNYGVIYPLQTLSSGRQVVYSDLPFLLEGSDSNVLGHLKSVVSSISHRIQSLNSEDRFHVHLAAVFASNFTNHMLRISNQILAEKGLPADLLEPLAKETLEKALSLGPDLAQTGPAHRNDLSTLNRHLAALSEENQREIYQSVSRHIVKMAAHE